MKNTILSISAFLMLSVTSCKEGKKEEIAPATGKMDLRIATYANGKSFKLDSTYITSNGDDFTCEFLKFYMSDLKLRKKGTNEFVSIENFYFLYDQAEAELSHARIDHAGNAHLSGIPVGEYDQVSFNIGISQPRNNDTTSFEGALDPSNNMYWEWTKEFIFFKFEGKSSKSPTGALVYHVAEDANLRRIYIDLKINPVTVRTDSKQKVLVKLEVDKIFSALSIIDFSKENFAMSGNTASKIANNYAKSFSFHSIE